jgi:hypothetical protein
MVHHFCLDLQHSLVIDFIILPLSLKISICWLFLMTFDYSSYSKNLWKYYLFCYDMFYHRIYFKCNIIIFIFSEIFWIRQMIKRASQKSGECLYLVTEEVYCKATSFNLLLDVVESQLSCLGLCLILICCLRTSSLSHSWRIAMYILFISAHRHRAIN